MLGLVARCGGVRFEFRTAGSDSNSGRDARSISMRARNSSLTPCRERPSAVGQTPDGGVPECRTLPANDSPVRWRWRQLIPTCDPEARLRPAFTASASASPRRGRSRSRMPNVHRWRRWSVSSNRSESRPGHAVAGGRASSLGTTTTKGILVGCPGSLYRTSEVFPSGRLSGSLLAPSSHTAGSGVR